MRLFILGMAFVVGCAPTRYVEAPMTDVIREDAVVHVIHGDTRYLPTERAAWIEAAKRTAELTDGRARAYFVFDLDETRYMMLAEEPHAIRTPAWMATDRTAGDSTDALRVVPEKCPDLLACMMHELAHHFGMGHPDYQAPHSVMNEKNPGHVWTHTDRAECRTVGLCRELIPKDVTTVTVTIDPAIPRVEPEYPWPSP